jgi:hypothetical protein
MAEKRLAYFSKQYSSRHGSVIYLNEKNEEVECSFIYEDEEDEKIYHLWEDIKFVGIVIEFVRKIPGSYIDYFTNVDVSYQMNTNYKLLLYKER